MITELGRLVEKKGGPRLEALVPAQRSVTTDVDENGFSRRAPSPDNRGTRRRGGPSLWRRPRAEIRKSGLRRSLLQAKDAINGDR